MLLEYNLGRRKKRARKLSDILHNEDAHEFLRDPINNARQVIKKIKKDTETKLMSELSDKDNEYKFGPNEKINPTQKGTAMMPSLGEIRGIL